MRRFVLSYLTDFFMIAILYRVEIHVYNLEYMN